MTGCFVVAEIVGGGEEAEGAERACVSPPCGGELANVADECGGGFLMSTPASL